MRGKSTMRDGLGMRVICCQMEETGTLNVSGGFDTYSNLANGPRILNS